MSNLRSLWGMAITVIAFMSGILSIVREVLQFVDPVKFPERSIFFASLRVAFLVAIGLLWWQEKRARIVAETLLEKSKPHFELNLGDLVWQYREDVDLTLFYILTSILNRGEPSVALNWNAKYILNAMSEQMEFYTISTPHEIDLGDRTVTFTNDNLTNVRALETPIQKGQWIGGRILCTVRGNRTAQVLAAQYRIEVTCADYTGAKCSAMYVPAAEPPRTFLTHYAEHVQQPNRALPANPETAVLTKPGT